LIGRFKSKIYNKNNLFTVLVSILRINSSWHRFGLDLGFLLTILAMFKPSKNRPKKEPKDDIISVHQLIIKVNTFPKTLVI